MSRSFHNLMLLDRHAHLGSIRTCIPVITSHNTQPSKRRSRPKSQPNHLSAWMHSHALRTRIYHKIYLTIQTKSTPFCSTENATCAPGILLHNSLQNEYVPWPKSDLQDLTSLCKRCRFVHETGAPNVWTRPTFKRRFLQVQECDSPPSKLHNPPCTIHMPSL